MASRNFLAFALMAGLVACTEPEGAVRRALPGAEATSWVDVQVDPPQRHEFATMKVGARQHVDRRYAYEVVPSELTGGLLYQGIHRPPKGLSVTLVLKKPARVFFFFHDRYDGGYTKIFSQMTNWVRRPEAPQYDLAGGDHGRNMLLFAADLPVGTHVIPPTTKARACFSIVFDFTGTSAGPSGPN